MSVMNSSEEQVVFYFELGLAITQWANVERELFNVVALCGASADRNLWAMGFFSIENFRSKAAFVDQVFGKKYVGTKFMDEWPTIYEDVLGLSKKRNKLAHYNVMNFPSEKAGRRTSLQPWIRPKPKSDKERLSPVPGSLCVRDIVQVRYEFFAGMASLTNLQYRVIGREEPFPKSAERPMRPPTIRQLRDQIHAMLGHQQKSSRQKRREEDAANAAASLKSGDLAGSHS